MRKIKRFIVIGIAGTILFAPPVNASSSVQYKNQRAGEFCKEADIGKFVMTPKYGKLICAVKPGTTKPRWVYP